MGLVSLEKASCISCRASCQLALLVKDLNTMLMVIRFGNTASVRMTFNWFRAICHWLPVAHTRIKELCVMTLGRNSASNICCKAFTAAGHEFSHESINELKEISSA